MKYITLNTVYPVTITTVSFLLVVCEEMVQFIPELIFKLSIVSFLNPSKKKIMKVDFSSLNMN